MTTHDESGRSADRPTHEEEPVVPSANSEVVTEHEIQLALIMPAYGSSMTFEGSPPAPAVLLDPWSHGTGVVPNDLSSQMGGWIFDGQSWLKWGNVIDGARTIVDLVSSSTLSGATTAEHSEMIYIHWNNGGPFGQ